MIEQKDLSVQFSKTKYKCDFKIMNLLLCSATKAKERLLKMLEKIERIIQYNKSILFD